MKLANSCYLRTRVASEKPSTIDVKSAAKGICMGRVRRGPSFHPVGQRSRCSTGEGSGGVVRPSREIGSTGFLELPENRLALHAARKLWPDSRWKRSALVTVYGPPGVGKTELTRELRRAWEQQPDARIRQISLGDFVHQFSTAQSADTLNPFQNRWRKEFDLLIGEDLQVLAGNPAAQRDWVVIQDHVLAHGGRVLLTSQRPPGEIRGLHPRLVNRCHGGLCVAIDPPGHSSRLKLLMHFAAAQQLPFDRELAEKVVQTVTGSPRLLQGFLQQVNARLAQRRGIALPQVVEQVLETIEHPDPVNLSEIARQTARYFEISVNDLKGPRRAQPVVFARHVAMYLARELTGEHLQRIGDFFGGRNHTTVLHALRQMTDRLQDDSTAVYHVEQIRSRLGLSWSVPG